MGVRRWRREMEKRRWTRGSGGGEVAEVRWIRGDGGEEV